jgi:probable phosphoglycerate mutase
MKKTTTLYIVRHGQTSFNANHVIGGTLEPNPLSRVGTQEAQILANRLRHVLFDVIYSSDLSRAAKTAEIIAAKRNLTYTVDPLLRERSWGALQGKTFREARKKHPKAFQKESTIEGKAAMDFKYVPDMESLKSAVQRFESFLQRVVIKHPGKTILIVCHFDIMIGYLVSVGYGSYQDLMNAAFNHTGYYKLIHTHTGFRVKEVVGLKRNSHDKS